MQNILMLLSFIFGTIIGSFLNVVIWRLPQGKNLNGRSHCPSCDHILGVLDLVPLLSFIFLRGRCHWCGSKISWRYFILEFATGLLFALAWFYIQPTDLISGLLLFKDWLTVSALVVVFMVDLEHMIILDQVIFPVSIVVFILNLTLDLSQHLQILSLQSHTTSGFIGAVALFLLFLAVWFFSSGKWMGFGDVKLVVLLGLVAGWPQAAVLLMLAVLTGGVVSIFLLLFSGKNLKSQIPFGTFLAFGTVLALFYGEKLLSWYLAILGF
jgi:prepilin signal peptidase PulO-like enzyme (type II secretory pathway)